MLINIVIVDDEKDIRSGLQNYFNWGELGYRIVGSVSNGVEALEIIKKQKVHVVLSDIVMPQMDGIELARRISSEYPDIKVVFLSAYEEFTYAKEALKYGVKGYILKPTNDSDLTDVFTKLRDAIYIENGIQQGLPIGKPHGQTNKVIKAVMDYLENNYQSATLSEIASEIYFNPFYLSSYFKHQTGESFTDCLIRIRMEKAADLILNSDYKIYEIGEMIGYSNAHNFIRAFKSFYNSTPLNFKKEAAAKELESK